ERATGDAKPHPRIMAPISHPATDERSVVGPCVPVQSWTSRCRPWCTAHRPSPRGFPCMTPPADTPARAHRAARRYIYAWGGGRAEGDASMRDLLGGKGAGLAEMTIAGLPVPAGFTITTAACNDYFANGG